MTFVKLSFFAVLLVSPALFGAEQLSSCARVRSPWHTRSYQLLPEEVAKTRSEAVKKRDIAALKKLFNTGVEVDAMNESAQTALHEAVIAGHADVITFLLDHGADINLGDGYSWTPLHLAAIAGYAEHDATIAALLVSRGANVSIKNRMDHIPLDAALDRGQQKTIDYLRNVMRMTPEELKKHKEKTFGFSRI